MLVCDAQVHAPVVPALGPVGSIDEAPLLTEMKSAGVSRAILVPRPYPGNAADNMPSLRLADRHPDRFGVVGLIDLHDPAKTSAGFEAWLDHPRMLGQRVLAYREPNRTLLGEGRLQWLWKAAERYRIPTMVLAPDLLDRVAEVAATHPGLPLVIDHMGIDPDVDHYSRAELVAAVERTSLLARFPNVAVKASRAPGAVAESFPFPSVHEPLERLVEAFGPSRVFWGSDLTKLTCRYDECVTLFTKELSFLDGDDLELVMGRAICEWLDWKI